MGNFTFERDPLTIDDLEKSDAVTVIPDKPIKSGIMLLNTDKLPKNFKLTAVLKSLGFSEKEKVYVVTSPDQLIFVEKAPALLPHMADEPGLDVYQTEFPLRAAPWIVDAIENKLWRSSTEGGLPPGTTHLKALIEGEDLKIRRVMNVGAPGQKGFALFNFSRAHPVFESKTYQEIHVTDMLLREGGLLDVLRDTSLNQIILNRKA